MEISERNRRYLREFRLMDDVFLSKFFEDNIECTQLVLHIILENPDLHVNKVTTQYSIKNLQGRSVQLDVFATDSTGKKYNIEIQRANKGAGTRRARYHSSMIDTNIAQAGDVYYDLLADTYVIFITENDVLGGGLPIYHIKRMICESGKPFDDGSHIIYVNANNKQNTPLGKLMHDFTCKNPQDMNYPLLAQRARYLKETEKGAIAMSDLMEQFYKEVKEEITAEITKKVTQEVSAEITKKVTQEVSAQVAEETTKKVSAETAKENSITTAHKLLKLNKITYEEIALCTNLTVEQVKALAQEKPA